MRTLATIMVSICTITIALFAHALATVDQEPARVDVVQVAAR